jgi:Zn-dependent metalloprotease
LPFDVNRDGVFDLIPPYPLFSGTPLLTEGHVFTGSEDPNATTLYHNLKRVYDFYKVVFERDSVDGEGLKLVGCVHFDDDATTPGFQNAWWFHGLAVFGDGDGEVFRSFGDFLDLTAHELTHGVVETTAMLKYENQAGALNESLADVFASMVKQWSKSPQQKAREADWLIGRGLFMVPDARALRDLANPGTAYGTAGLFDISDPQPQDMDGYVEIYPPDGDPNTGNDSGGVHLYSGIPNRAFYLVATTLGGYSWDVAGRIWYDAMRDVDLRSVDPRTAFKSFANLTVKHAQRHGTAAVDAVNAAWTAVKVFPRSHL